ncbi:MAG: hypothetical protein O2779_02565 [Nanoarchaeota archaeon]|nr:hypothetical protein [Nanoarchaeota archaeon]
MSLILDQKKDQLELIKEMAHSLDSLRTSDQDTYLPISKEVDHLFGENEGVWIMLLRKIEVLAPHAFFQHVHDQLRTYKRSLSMSKSHSALKGWAILQGISDLYSPLRTYLQLLKIQHDRLSPETNVADKSQWRDLLRQIEGSLGVTVSPPNLERYLEALTEKQYLVDLKKKISDSVHYDPEWTYFRKTFLLLVASGKLVSHVRNIFLDDRCADELSSNREIKADHEAWEQVLERCIEHAGRNTTKITNLIKHEVRQVLIDLAFTARSSFNSSPQMLRYLQEIGSLVEVEIGRLIGASVDMRKKLEKVVGSFIEKSPFKEEIMERGFDFEEKLRKFISEFDSVEFQKQIAQHDEQKISLAQHASRVGDTFPEPPASDRHPLSLLYGALVVANLQATLASLGIVESNMINMIREKNRLLTLVDSLEKECIYLTSLMGQHSVGAIHSNGGEIIGRSTN